MYSLVLGDRHDLSDQRTLKRHDLSHRTGRGLGVRTVIQTRPTDVNSTEQRVSNMDSVCEEKGDTGPITSLSTTPWHPRP